jgi:hypothetical protein
MDTSTVLVQAVQFGYKRYGPKGAVAAAVAAGASYVAIKRVLPRYTDVDEERVEELYDQVSEEGVPRSLGRGVEALVSSNRRRP